MSKLLYVEGTVDRSCTQSHITYSFHISQPTEIIRIQFSYTPKLLEDQEQARSMIEESMRRYGYDEPGHAEEAWKKYTPLQNLLTLSVDDPVRHRGNAHRPEMQQEHRLGSSAASPGFVAAGNPTGMWRITVSLHAVVTEALAYSIEVWGEDAAHG
ncbi:hypothetical protein [Paenibacillus brasilensis]|uniref:Uncharacterized protein n=1 Tax=Paenibacillus brasilensis TaxID=128574 RepID=A0ABU0KS97_9BACL|nr:hypothetical protein [Paenibacillus brasilensis]MDQ0492313.1 hypothetical protein [Paenibacillus brasilensis]